MFFPLRESLFFSCAPLFVQFAVSALFFSPPMCRSFLPCDDLRNFAMDVVPKRLMVRSTRNNKFRCVCCKTRFMNRHNAAGHKSSGKHAQQALLWSAHNAQEHVCSLGHQAKCAAQAEEPDAAKLRETEEALKSDKLMERSNGGWHCPRCRVFNLSADAALLHTRDLHHGVRHAVEEGLPWLGVLADHHMVACGYENRWWCRCCVQGSMTAANAAQHVDGERHRAKCAELAPGKDEHMARAEGRWYCACCATYTDDADEHVHSTTHTLKADTQMTLRCGKWECSHNRCANRKMSEDEAAQHACSDEHLENCALDKDEQMEFYRGTWRCNCCRTQDMSAADAGKHALSAVHRRRAAGEAELELGRDIQMTRYANDGQWECECCGQTKPMSTSKALLHARSKKHQKSRAQLALKRNAQKRAPEGLCTSAAPGETGDGTHKNEFCWDNETPNCSGCVYCPTRSCPCERLAMMFEELYEKLSVKRTKNGPGKRALCGKSILAPFVSRLIRQLRMAGDDTFIDLGCGNGSVCFQVAAMLGVPCIGVELDWNNSNLARQAWGAFKPRLEHWLRRTMPEVEIICADLQYYIAREFGFDPRPNTVIWSANLLMPPEIDVEMVNRFITVPRGVRIAVLRDLWPHGREVMSLRDPESRKHFHMIDARWPISREGTRSVVEWTAAHTGEYYMYESKGPEGAVAQPRETSQPARKKARRESPSPREGIALPTRRRLFDEGEWEEEPPNARQEVAPAPRAATNFLADGTLIEDNVMDCAIHGRLMDPCRVGDITTAVGPNSVWLRPSYIEHELLEGDPAGANFPRDKILLIPVNIDNLHWVLAVAKWGTPTIGVYDSCEGFQVSMRSTRLRLLNDVLNKAWDIPSLNRKIEMKPTVQQISGSEDCAVHVLNNCWRVAGVERQTTRAQLRVLMGGQ